MHLLLQGLNPPMKLYNAVHCVCVANLNTEKIGRHKQEERPKDIIAVEYRRTNRGVATTTLCCFDIMLCIHRYVIHGAE